MNDPETSSPGSTRTGALVELVGVKKAFPRAASPALHDFSARFQTGGVTGLVGPDGAGKTTLLRLVAGLLLPTEGSIHVDGLNPARESSRLRDILGYMPQKFGLYEDLTVQENLDLHADLRGVVGNDRVEAFRRLLEFTDLASFTRRLAGKLSGGMKQKLGLACALLGKPRLLLLDEPSVGVDPISRRELWRMVSGLASQGITIVWSTSYLDEAERCSHILLLNEGRLLFTGKPAEIHRRLENRCVRIENVAGNRRQLLTRALARPEVLDGTIQGHGVRLVLREGTEAPALAELEAGAEARIVRTTPRFEDGFIDLLGGGAPGESPLAQRAHQVSGTEGVVVEATDLTKKFGDFAATDSVSFCVRRGEVYGLLGPNGAGKSTTFRMLCGLLTPTSGIARVLGIDLKTSAARARQHLGYMAQKFSLYGTLSVRQNLEFFSGIYGLSGARQREVVA
jgi:ABC-2 type transport system ATP-binding protein